MIRIGVKIPNDGELPTRLGIGAMSRSVEDAGFSSIWTTDHIVQPHVIESPYPFTSSARPEWDHTTPWFDAVVVMSMMAAATSRVEVGFAVLVAPLRHPVEVAKQLASIDALSGGRVVCGIGAGWMAEEYEAMGIDFPSRGRRLDEWTSVARAVWTGEPGVLHGTYYDLPVATSTYPAPLRDIPILVGGMSPAALRRAGRADGWVGHQNFSTLDLDGLRQAITRIHAASTEAERPVPPRITMRLGESAGHETSVAEVLPFLTEAGVDDVIVDVDWTDPDGARRAAGALLHQR